MIDKALTVARQISGIKIFVFSVSTDIVPGRSARINIADSFMIGKKVDALTHPARASYVAIKLKKALECSATSWVTP